MHLNIHYLNWVVFVPLQGFWVFTIQIMSGESEVIARAVTVGRNHREHYKPYCKVKNVCLDVISSVSRTVCPIYCTAGLLTRDTYKKEEHRQRGSCAIPLTWARGEADVNKLENSVAQKLSVAARFVNDDRRRAYDCFFIWGVLSFILDRLFGEIGATWIKWLWFKLALSGILSSERSAAEPTLTLKRLCRNKVLSTLDTMPRQPFKRLFWRWFIEVLSYFWPES